MPDRIVGAARRKDTSLPVKVKFLIIGINKLVCAGNVSARHVSETPAMTGASPGIPPPARQGDRFLTETLTRYFFHDYFKEYHTVMVMAHVLLQIRRTRYLRAGL